MYPPSSAFTLPLQQGTAEAKKDECIQVAAPAHWSTALVKHIQTREDNEAMQCFQDPLGRAARTSLETSASRVHFFNRLQSCTAQGNDSRQLQRDKFSQLCCGYLHTTPNLSRSTR